MTGDLFSNHGGGGGSAGPSSGGFGRGSRDLVGTVFFEITPDLSAADRAVALGDRLGAEDQIRSQVSREVLHVTLAPIGVLPDLSDERIAAACKVAAGLVAKPFEIAFNRLGTFVNGTEKPPLTVFADSGAGPIDLFRQVLIADLRRAGFVIKKRLPKPHMTLCYDRHVLAERAIEPISWQAREFVLVHSIFGEGRHVVLGRWPLRG